jgi:hypothetical protein
MIKITMTVMGALALLSPCHASGGDEPDPEKIVATTLTSIRETPESYKHVWVTFPVQFASVGRLQNPFFTRFIATDFANFYVWPDEQPIWRKEQYDDMFGTLFVSKDKEFLNRMMRLETYDRLQVTGVVRNTFQGLPWIEITSYEVLDGKVSTATLSHLYRGEEYMKQRKWTQAISELSLAPVDEVPDHVRAAAHRNLAICYLRMGEASMASQHLEAATALTGADKETQRWSRLASSDPSAALDREVNRQAVKDHERPIWEAFSNVSGGNDLEAPASPMSSQGR